MIGGMGASSQVKTPRMVGYLLGGSSQAAGFALLRCGMLRVNSCACPRFAELMVRCCSRIQFKSGSLQPSKNPTHGGVFTWWLLPDSNWGHKALQASALPTELKSRIVGNEVPNDYIRTEGKRQGILDVWIWLTKHSQN